MPNASTVASVVVALAAIVVTVRWPRRYSDRQLLERRANGLEALGVVVNRSVASRSIGSEFHRATPADEPAAAQASITVLGSTAPCEAPSNPATLRRSQRQGRSHRTPRHRSSGSGPRRPPATPTNLVRLTNGDLPCDEELHESFDSLDAGPRHPDAVSSAGSPSGCEGTLRTGSAPTRRRASEAPNPSTRIRPSTSAPVATHPLAPARPTTTRRWLAAAATMAVLAGALTLAVARPDGGPVPSVPGGSAEAEPAPPAPPVEATAPPSLLPVGTLGDTVGFALAPPFTLDLATSAVTWVRVQAVSGEVLFEGTLEAGGSTSVQVASPVRVRVGNPVGLLVAANGQLLDHPRPPGQPLTLSLG